MTVNQWGGLDYETVRWTVSYWEGETLKHYTFSGRRAVAAKVAAWKMEWVGQLTQKQVKP